MKCIQFEIRLLHNLIHAITYCLDYNLPTIINRLCNIYVSHIIEHLLVCVYVSYVSAVNMGTCRFIYII